MRFHRSHRIRAALVCTLLSCAAAYASGISALRGKAQAGDAAAQIELGGRLLMADGVARDPVEAQQWFRRAADKGSAEAQNSLGVMVSFGQGVKRDPVAGVRWFRLAGHADLPRTVEFDDELPPAVRD